MELVPFEVENLHALYAAGVMELSGMTDRGQCDELYLTECTGCCGRQPNRELGIRRGSSYRLFREEPFLQKKYHGDTNPDTIVAKVYNEPSGLALGVAQRIAEFYDGSTEILLRDHQRQPRMIRISRNSD